MEIVQKFVTALLFVSWFVLWNTKYTNAQNITDMKNVIHATLNNSEYSAKVRPIRDQGLILTVTVDLFLIALNEIDDVEQRMKSTAYMKIEWSDTFLQWTPATYGGITEYFYPQSDIWKPDLALSNAFTTVTGLGDSFVYVKITNAGVVTWYPYQVFESTCDMDMTYFPFDKQSCALTFVTWSSDSSMINLNIGSTGVDQSDFQTNADWNLVSTATADSSTSTSAAVTFTLNIKRKPAFYLLTFIMPIVLLSLLNILVFILPAESGEKTGYAIVAFLSFAVFLLIVTDIMPEGMRTTPVLSTYLLVQSVISTIIVLVTIIQLRLFNLGDDATVPRCFRACVKGVYAFKRCIFCDSKTKKSQQRTTSALAKRWRQLQIAMKTGKGYPKRSSIAPEPEEYHEPGHERWTLRTEKLPKAVSTNKKPDSSEKSNNSASNAKKANLKKVAESNKDERSSPNNGSPNATGDKVPLNPRSKPSSRSSKKVVPMTTRDIELEEISDDDNSSASSLSQDDDDDITWADVVTAMDFLFFFVFGIAVIVSTGISLSVAVAGGNG